MLVATARPTTMVTTSMAGRSMEENFQRATSILALVRPEIELLDSTQLFDTTMADWARRCSGAWEGLRSVARHLGCPVVGEISPRYV
eukprot:Skav223145  [mRNA]  locus=scaffold3011:105968:106228:- [translate_table: standard]